MTRYRWFRAGDLNAFFALMFDNVANLVILAAILIGAFGFPKEIVLYRMVPGTAVGVLVGDLIYAWMAGRLARRTGRPNVTAMPLGLNAPSVFGMAFAVLGPAYLLTGDAELSWKMGMAVTVLAGLFKMGLALVGNAVRAAVPRAGLLGSIAGAGVALIALLPLLKIFSNPIPGLLAFGVLLVTLVGRVRLPGGLPGAFVSALLGLAVHYALSAGGLTSPLLAAAPSTPMELRLSFPWPTLAFLGGLTLAWGYLPIVLPFSLATVVGGIDNTESAAAAGDEYDTRAILMTEGFCTLVAGLCGGVVESTPYIGHPAYKAMGAGAGYTILTALFVGLGGIVGYLPLFVDWIPAAAIAPILVYIGMEVVAQAFLATPARHGVAVALALLPSLAFVVALEVNSLLDALRLSVAALTGEMAESVRTLNLLGNGFILSALLWGAATAELIDHRFARSALYLAAGAVFCLFGVIHSPVEQGTFFLPWRADSPLVFHLALAYLAAALAVAVARFLPAEATELAT
ncbi:MAG: MFS transporter [Acidobacteria bacterium]|nr:MFS transporter [Acidobacteriota bacterium]